MESAGSWPYTYTRLTVAPPCINSTSATFENHMDTITTSNQTVAGSTSTSSILIQPATATELGNSSNTFNSAGFLSPPTSAEYNSVFTPTFNHATHKPLHYNSVLSSNQRLNLQQRPGLQQVEIAATVKTENQSSNHNLQQHAITTGQPISSSNSFYNEHITNVTSIISPATMSWQQTNNVSLSSSQQIPSPFGILPHESIVPSTSGSTVSSTNSNLSTDYVNYTNSHYSPQSLCTTRVVEIKTVPNTSSSHQPKIEQTTLVPDTSNLNISSSTSNSTQYCRQPLNISPASACAQSTSQTANIYTNSKPPPLSSRPMLNHTCIVVTSRDASANVSNSKDLNLFNSAKNNLKSNISNCTNVRNSRGNISQRSPSAIVSPVSLTNSPKNNSSIISPVTNITKASSQTLHLVQTKAQTKVYPELVLVGEQNRTKLTSIDQSDQYNGAISYYTIIDGKIAYTAPGNANIIINDTSKSRSSNFASARHFVIANNPELPTDCRPNDNVEYYPVSICTNDDTIPTKSDSPQLITSQTRSPAFALYHNSVDSSEPPSQHSSNNNLLDNQSHIVVYEANTAGRIGTSSPHEVSMSRNPNNSAVVYSSVITRAVVNESTKTYEQEQTFWGNEEKPKKYYTLSNNIQNEIVMPADIHLKQSFQNSHQSAQIGALQNLTKIEGPVTENILVTTDHPLVSQIHIPTKTQESQSSVSIIPSVIPQATLKRTNRCKIENSIKTREQLLSENEFLTNRAPPLAHCSKASEIVPETVINLQPQHNGQSLETVKWNESSSTIRDLNTIPSITFSNQQAINIQPQHSFTSIPYLSAFHIANASCPKEDISKIISSNNNINGSTSLEEGVFIENSKKIECSSYKDNKQRKTESSERKDEQTHKVIVPNIEEELEFLSDSSLLREVPSAASNPHITGTLRVTGQLSNLEVKSPQLGKLRSIKDCGVGFMASYLKFLQGERENSPPPANRTIRKPSLVSTVSNFATNAQSTSKLDISNSNGLVNTTLTNVSSIENIISLPNITKTIQPISNEDDNINVPSCNFSSNISLKENKRKTEDNTNYIKPKTKVKKMNTSHLTRPLISQLPKKARPQMAMQMTAIYNSSNSTSLPVSPVSLYSDKTKKINMMASTAAFNQENVDITQDMQSKSITYQFDRTQEGF